MILESWTRKRTTASVRFFGSILALGGLGLAAAGTALATPGSGESYWGPIPAAADSTTDTVDDPGKPAWEKVVNFPYNVFFFPLKVTVAGLELATEALDESPTFRRLIHLFPIRIGRVAVSGGISVGTTEGFGGNVSADVADFLGKGNALKLRAGASTNGEGNGTLGVRYRRTPRSWVEIGGGYRSNVNALFYGIGPKSRERRESFYREEMSWVGASYARRVGSSNFAWQGSVFYSGIAATGTDDSEDPHLSTEFAGELPVGYRDRSDGISLALELSHDDTAENTPGGPRPERGRPERGGLRRAKVAYFQEKGNGNAQFWTYRGELQQFFTLWFSRRALALRGLVTGMQDAGGDEVIPFQRLVTNDDPDLLRGYEDYRFRDRGLAVVSAEYRWPVWSAGPANGLGVDAYGFVDYGQVFDELGDIDRDDLTTSYGGGLRAAGFGQFLARFEVAKADEDWIFRLRADQLFQFERGGLFHGRNPVPER